MVDQKIDCGDGMQRYINKQAGKLAERGIGAPVLDYHDFVQEGMIAEYVCRQEFDESKGSFFNFAHRRISGSMTDAVRKVVHRRRESIEVYSLEAINQDQWVEDTVAGPELNPEDVVIAGQRRRLLGQLLSSLPKNEMIVIFLKLFNEEQGTEIARSLGLSPARISQIYNQGKNRLIKNIQDSKIPAESL